MRTRFPPGSTVYAKGGRSYVVEDVADGIVYCNHIERRRDRVFGKLAAERSGVGVQNHGRPAAGSVLCQTETVAALSARRKKLDAAAVDRLLAKAERLSPSILDFVAFTVATHILAEHKEEDLVERLSIRKCRELFDAALPAVRACLLANLLGVRPDALVSAGGLVKIF